MTFPLTDIVSWIEEPIFKAVFLTTCVITPLFFGYLHHKYSFWSKRGINGPRPTPLVGNVFCYGNGEPAKDVEAKLLKKYGKLVGMYEGVNPVLLVADPDVIKDILVKKFASFTDTYQWNGHHVLTNMVIQMAGNEWRKTRSIVTPTFTSGKMKQMLPLVTQSVSLLETAIKKHIKSGQEVMDAKHFFTCLTLDVIAKVAFATDINVHENKDNPFVEQAKLINSFSTLRFLGGTFLTTTIKRLINFSIFDPTPRDFFLDACQAMLEQKRRTGNQMSHKFPDFGQLLLEARNEQGEGLTEKQLIANSFIILVAGFETTATTMTLIAWVLSTQPEIQEKLYQEVKKCSESNGGQLDYDSVGSLPYLDAFIQETLRLYPPVVRFDRVASDDVTLDNGLEIPKGTVMRIPAFSIHRNEEYWKDADTFNPERFLPENKDQLVPYTFMPFVLGPRNCIGMRFALMEAKHATAHILLKFRFKQPPNPTPIDFTAGTFMLTPNDVFVGVEERQQ